MSVKVGPKIVKDGLIFDLDAAVSRSYSGSGLTAYSLIGGIGATLVNGTGYSSANKGSFFFDGANDYIVSPSDSAYAFGTNDFTIFAWFKSSDKSRYNNIFNLYETSNDGIILYSNAGNGFFRTWVGPTLLVGDIDITNNIWNQVSLRRSSGTITQFINGIQNLSTTTSYSVPINILKIGSVVNNYYCNGNISQVQVYNKALTAQEILQNYNATKGRYI
jgi:hypothetical protein